MLSCFWQLRNCLDLESMESKKAFGPNPPDAVIGDPALKHSHQHNSGPLHLTLVQYGPKVPNQHVHTALQLPTRSHHHPGITPNAHPHNHQQYHRTHQWPCEQVPTLPLEQYYQPSIGPQALNRNEIYNYGVQQHQKYKTLQTPSSSPISPQIKDLEKKVKPNTGNQQLKSPSAKRPIKAPVTLQGWLHKQGSEGLMLWKKRWFVLSEYCLYYYKSPQEEKLLGSILLPSYKVSVCQPEDRVNKKHSFKCEHANMRTYILAADSQELMKQWVHVLTMASLLQTTFDIQRPIQFNFENSPVHQHSVSNTTELSNQSQSSQPLYANAPPKPRRLTDEYTSPSPEMMDTYSNGPRYVTLDPSYCKEQVRLQKKLPKSPTDIYGNLRFFPEAQRHHHHPQQLPLAKNNLHALPDHAYIHGFQNTERRTPDTYGPSKLNNPRSRQPSDYEDIYGENFMYKRPLSPLQYTRPAQVQRPVIYRAPQIPINNCQPPPSQKILEVIPRPHSADFLEYQMKHEGPAMVAKCQPRPKSSLDINKHAPNDTYFYSEQHYAEKMRKSVQYLPHMLPNVEYGECIRRKTENPLHFRSLAREHNLSREVQPVRSRSVLSDGSLCRSPEVDFDDSLCKDAKLAFYNRSDNIHGFEEDLNKMSPIEYNQFCRSASARFINKQLNDKATSREGDRKREESMKRLLEWKQRMLQSPLNRKAQNFQAKKFNTPNRYASPEFRQDAPPLLSSNSQYNSYSSDDEEIHDGSNECTEMQAGRTSDAFPCTSQSHSPALITPTNVTIPEVEPERTSATKELVDAVLEKPLKLSNTYPTPTALVSSLRSEFHNEFKDSLPVTQMPSTGALVKNILYGFENGGGNASSVFESGGADENYMTMTSRSSILSSGSGNFETRDPLALKTVEADENPYVEMTQNAAAANSMLMPNANKNEAQTYEIVCFSDAKMEPVYVELNQSATADAMLPDVLLSLQHKSTPKSDSSDADDEVSKELDSLDTSSGHPRFSLSDTFRPASYYLGVSATNAEPQDSSDSELVSPPPIPTSSPPLDDAENISNTLALYSVFSETNNTTADTSSAFYSSSSMFGLNSTADMAKEIANIEHSEDDCLHNENGGDCKLGTVYQNIILKQPMLSEECQCSFSGECTGLNDPFQTNMKVLVFPNYENLCMYNLEDSKTLSLNECASAVTSQLSIEDINSALGVSNGLNHHPAPYYYSDLSINTSDTNSVSSVLTLNNQRCSVIGNKRDIAHIVNPIKRSSHILNATHPPHHMPSGNPLRLAAEARSASADFLNIADKSGSIDEKNIYESDTLKRIKSIAQPVTDALNFYPSSKTDKFNGKLGPCSEANMRRSYSLEGLLESPLLHNVVIAHLNSQPRQKDNEVVEAAVVTEGSHLWEEDAIWREQLRLASQRHTKSLEHLESTGDEVLQPKKQVRAITRAVTYVNDNMFCQKPVAKVLSDRDSDTLQAACQGSSSFTIDREKLRQWDFLSSAPSDTQASAMALPPDKVAGAGAASDTSVIDKPASGSVSINASTIPVPSSSIKRNSRKTDGEKDLELQHLRAHTLQYGTGEYERPVHTREKWQVEDKMNMSAGELLSRTHEELVLLLIQLRRKSANTCNAIDGCYNEIDKLQSQLLPKMDAAKRLESLHKLEEIKQHLLELEKQYEKGKPLVNLVDNMVKLGSLYKFPKETIENTVMKNRLEFNQQVQERRLLAEERRDWNRSSPNHDELQAKVNQLYHLDRLIQEESGTLHALQHDKEEIERVLGGLRNRFSEGFDDPAEVEHARRQQFVLENELSRIHTLLARNSRKLEETVVGNARLEQELLVLKQKLQTSRQQRFSPQISNAGDSLPCMVGNSTVLESDLYKVQQNVGDLERQRLELSMQVRQLTDRSSIVQPIRSSSNSRIPQGNKKKITALWRETDLDTMKSIDHGHFQNCHSDDHSPMTPLYVNMDVTDPELSPVSGETTTIYNLPHERQEIKTVRIVKRESERRQRDREKMTSEKWDPLAEEDSNLSQSQRGLPDHLGAKNDDGATTSGCYTKPDADSSAETNLDKSAQLSPIFKSKAARQIMIEMSSSDAAKEVAPSNRRLVPKERRRHHTAPHNNLIMKSLSQLPIYDKELETFEPNSRRARDDMDMERALRQRINAPDIVRSTLGNKELKYNENTIDTILGTPNKIYIPERYIPEQLPQLSVEEQQHRLRKVESIKKMLSDSAVISSSTANLAASDDATTEDVPSSGSTSKLTTRMIEEKKQREHLLQLNQILAKQVIEMSKIVAEKALIQRTRHPPSSDEELSSPEIPLPIYQQRDNFYS